jgi:hypothetical protein
VFVLKQEIARKRALAVSTCDGHGRAVAATHLELESVVPVLRRGTECDKTFTRLRRESVTKMRRARSAARFQILNS